jgi:cystathionine beta-lyase
MKWNFDEAPGREGTDSVRYDLRKQTFGTENVIPLWVADMDFKTPDFIVEALQGRVSHEIYGYTFRSEKYFSSIIGWLQRRHNWEIKKEWVCFTPGIVPALNLCTLSFTKPGDNIIVQPPVYFPFFTAVSSHNRNLVYNNLLEKNGEWMMDFKGLKRSIDDKTKMLIFCNPHNPVGKVWKREELLELAEICVDKNIIILSDEIHSDLVLSGNRHYPVAALNEKTAGITATCIAPSKTFNLAGLSTSSVIISDPGLRSAFRKTVEDLHIGNGNIFGNVASVAAYSKGDKWLDELVLYLEGNARYIAEIFRTRIPVIKALMPEATYMIWLDCRELGMKGNALNDFFIKKAGVGLSEGSIFGPGGEGFMRMNFASPRSLITRAMEQIEYAVNNLRN